MIALYQYTAAQNKISGTITDQNNQPLVNASVFIPDLNKGTVSDKQGHYEIQNLPSGKLKIQFSFLGFINNIETLQLEGKVIELNVKLIQTSIEADEIVISGAYHSTQHQNAVKIDVLKLDPLTLKSTPNFSEMLTQVPGVDMISKGSGVSKPVIRGLSMNDILILNNDVRYENYQYSDHHPLGIDEFGIENVEVIKGPASLLYGSDAVGGVINFIKERPAPVGTLLGDYNLQLFSNTVGITNNLGIKGALKNIFGGIRVGHKNNADFLQGGGQFVPNSRFNEMSVKANIGTSNKTGSFKLFYDYNHEKLGLVEDQAIEAITARGRESAIWYQEFKTHLVSSENKFYLHNYKLDLNAAYQNTELTHFAEAGVYEIQMALSTITYETKLHLPSKANSEYIIGFQGFNQANTNLNNRQTRLLPDAGINNYSALGLVKYTFFSKLNVQAGMRYDTKSISTVLIGLPSDTMTYRPAINKNYGSFSGSLGATYNSTDKLLFRANFATAFRTPNLAELTSNGQHETRYEIGNPNLVPENTYETDLSTHYHSDDFTFDLAVYYNIIRNYIYISPTGIKTTSAVNIYKYKQSNSVLYGGEAGFHFHPHFYKWLSIETTFSSVTGKQENGDYLPFIPAHKLHFEIRAQKEKFAFTKNAFVAVNTTIALNQNNTAVDETATKGYTLVDLSVGSNVKCKNQSVSISIGANNLLDKKYIDHLSTLKEVGLYNPGRNVSISLKIPFGIFKND